MDGKHVLIQKPANSGSFYFNYKGTFSVILFAIVNAECEFIYVYTGTNGRVSDGGILKNTSLFKKLVENQLNIPPPEKLEKSNDIVPYHLIGDEAFPLMEHIMKPFSQRTIKKEEMVFNYRMCRARRISENAFGILAARFRVFYKPLQIGVKNIDAIVFAACALHNFLKKRSGAYMGCDANGSDTTSNTASLLSLAPINVGRPLSTASDMRETLKKYYNGEGKVNFQDKIFL